VYRSSPRFSPRLENSRCPASRSHARPPSRSCWAAASDSPKTSPVIVEDVQNYLKQRSQILPAPRDLFIDALPANLDDLYDYLAETGEVKWRPIVPDDLKPIEAAPLMCAGVTTFNSLRNAGARAGDLVAVLGIGGLGHLGVQYARRMGFNTVAINRGKDKEELARQLGAHSYIDATAQDVVAELQKLGGASVILATAPSAQAISGLLDGLAPSGKLQVPAAPQEPLTINVFSLIMKRSSVAGWYSGTAKDSQDTLEFSALSGVHPMIEKYPLDKVAEAYEQMHSGKVRFRVVLTLD